MESVKRINLGIVAHVDAGKTSITEQLLFHSGALRNAGSVDKGTAQTDFLNIERTRGISVRSASTVIKYNDVEINLIDTPGHMDFSAEVDRVLRVLDCALIVVPAVEGVQARTEIIFKALKKRNIPIIFFINKIDRIGADLEKVKSEISQYLSNNIITMQNAQTEVNASVCALNLSDMIEDIAEFNDDILEKYLSGDKISDSEISSVLTNLVHSGTVYPMCFGSALKDIGIFELLNYIVLLMPKSLNNSNELSGVVFRVEHDDSIGRIAHIRLYSGELKNRDKVYNKRLNIEEKVTQIRKLYGNKHIDIGFLSSGDIGAVCGLSNAHVGDIIGSDIYVPKEYSLTTPLLRVRVFAESDMQYPKLVDAMNTLMAEDPLLNVEWQSEERELLINITGTIQLEVIKELIQTRFGMNIEFGDASVIYKETIAGTGLGIVRYTMPKPCWACLTFKIEPLPQGSGIQYSSEVSNDKIFYKYQTQVANTIHKSLRQGMYGWEVIDVKITLIDGEHHIEHTHPLDFIVATPIGIMNGLHDIGTVLLEPMLRFRISVHEDVGGKIMSEIINLRGTFEPPVVIDNQFTLEGKIPAATSMDLPVWLASVSSGRGILVTEFDSYEPCPIELGAATPYRGVNPLDRAKYILSIRSALS